MYPTALKELQEGHKRSHWIWYIFPQLQQLGYSYYARSYGISGIDEASAYLENLVLNRRLREVSAMLLDLPINDASEILGNTDSLKLRSSMTLFDAVLPDDVFARVIDKYFNGEKDEQTLTILHIA